jgi:hypothetical protein
VPLRELGFRDIQRQQGDCTNLRLLLETFSGSQHDDCTKLTLRALSKAAMVVVNDEKVCRFLCSDVTNQRVTSIVTVRRHKYWSPAYRDMAN